MTKLTVHEQALARLRSASPEYLCALSVAAGVHTPDGRLTPEFGGAVEPLQLTSGHDGPRPVPWYRHMSFEENIKSAFFLQNVAPKDVGWNARRFCRVTDGSSRPTIAECYLLNEMMGLDFDALMGYSGHLGDGVLEYMMRCPSAGALLRAARARRLTEDDFRHLLQTVEAMPRRRRKRTKTRPARPRKRTT